MGLELCEVLADCWFCVQPVVPAFAEFNGCRTACPNGLRPRGFQENSIMRMSRFRTGLVALTAIVGMSVSSAAIADSGTVRISVVKGGWFIGASGGNGTLTFHGRKYPLSIGGISAGLVFGASQTNLRGRVSNIRRASDVAGVYGAAGAGAAVGPGVRSIVLRNEKGAVLTLSGRQVGLMANVDLSGMAISLK
jgi:hypothetical protein